MHFLAIMHQSDEPPDHPMTATAFKYLSYAALVLGVVLSFWVLRWGALCFLFSIACAHLAGSARADRHAEHIHETLFIVLSLLGQVRRKLDENRADSAADTANQEPQPKVDSNVQRLPVSNGTRTQHHPR